MVAAAVERWRVESDPKGTHVMPEDFTELVVGDLADEGGPQPQCSQAGRRVSGGAAADLPARAHRVVQAHRLGLVDQAHRSLVKSLLAEEGVVSVGDDIDDGVADAEHVIAGLGHEDLRSCGKLEFGRA